ncbi:MAG: NUDIX hydrolase [Pyrinomonadaceae bacterium]
MIEKSKSNFPTVKQVSAGGAVFRRNKDKTEFVIVSVNPSLRWQLPKGLVDAGETAEAAALREVREEAGIETEIVAPIETVEYWYVGEQHGARVRFHKFVHFYLLKYISGAVEDHDHEIAEARWVAPQKAIKMLAFKSECEVLEKAVSLIS